MRSFSAPLLSAREDAGDPVGAPVGAPVGEPVGEPVGNSVGNSVELDPENGDMFEPDAAEVVGEPVSTVVVVSVLCGLCSAPPDKVGAKLEGAGDTGDVVGVGTAEGTAVADGFAIDLGLELASSVGDSGGVVAVGAGDWVGVSVATTSSLATSAMHSSV